MKTIRALGHLNTATFSALQMILFTLIPVLSEKASLSLASVVLSFSVGSFLFLWASPFWSARSDSWGRMKVLAIGMIGLTISTGLLVSLILTPASASAAPWLNEITLWSSRLLYGLTASAIVPVAQALQMDLAPQEAPLKSMLSNSMSLNIGRALGPLYLLFGGAEHLLRLLEGAVVGALLLAFANIFFISKSLPQTEHSSSSSWRDWLSAFQGVRSLFVLALIFTTFIGILNFSLASILKSAFILSSTEASHLMAQVLLGSALFAVAIQAVGRKAFKNPWQGSLLIGAGGLLAGSVLLGAMASYGTMWGAIGLLSVGIALIPPSYLSLIASSSEGHHLGRKTGLAAAANTLGYTLGGLVAAMTFKLSPLAMPGVLIVVVLLISANIAWLYKKDTSYA